MSSYAEKLLPFLDVERPNDPISLKISDLTLKVKSVDREDYLWEIGSGSNWLSYHIAIIMALHQLFISFDGSPIPNFAVFDQPSQVYFPKKLVSRPSDEGMDYSKNLNDEDVIAARKIYSTLAQVVNSLNGKMQVIVMDHAAEDIWGEIDGIHLVEEWRNNIKLVPASWL